MTVRNATCASCAAFPREGLDGEGVATCAKFEKAVDYSHPSCILYESAKDREERRKQVQRLRQVAR